jgi:flagellar basal body-associated protein FliL
MEDKKGYGKRPLWQWIVIYLIVGAVVYGLIYYFVIAKNGAGYNSVAPAQQSAPKSGSDNY